MCVYTFYRSLSWRRSWGRYRGWPVYLSTSPAAITPSRPHPYSQNSSKVRNYNTPSHCSVCFLLALCSYIYDMCVSITEVEASPLNESISSCSDTSPTNKTGSKEFYYDFRKKKLIFLGIQGLRTLFQICI